MEVECKGGVELSAVAEARYLKVGVQFPICHARSCTLDTRDGL